MLLKSAQICVLGSSRVSFNKIPLAFSFCQLLILGSMHASTTFRVIMMNDDDERERSDE